MWRELEEVQVEESRPQLANQPADSAEDNREQQRRLELNILPCFTDLTSMKYRVCSQSYIESITAHLYGLYQVVVMV